MCWRARVQDRQASAPAVASTARRNRARRFSRVLRSRVRSCAPRPFGPLYTRPAEGGGGCFLARPFLSEEIRVGPRGGLRAPVPAEPDEIWDAIRGELRRETPDFKFHIWLEPLELAGIRGHTVYVRAPEHIRTSVAERYLPLLRRAASAGFDERALVEVVGGDWEPSEDGAAPQVNGDGAAPARHRDRLNPKYTFDQFVIGEGN